MAEEIVILADDWSDDEDDEGVTDPAEIQYDDIIAPMLAEVGKKCEELGFHLVARVEWSPNNGGITAIGNGKDAGVAQRLAYAAAMARGNFDSLCFHMLKNFDCRGSLFLNQYAKSQQEAV